MRQRKPKDLEKRIERCGAFLVADPGPDAWQEIFEGRDLYVEIGCGKGDFIIAKAMDDPESDYLGIEGQQSVLLRAVEKAMWIGEDRLCNLRFAGIFVRQMEELFPEGSLSGIYLNFSDPWPKKRHYKRRLTYRGRLEDYAKALKDGGFIEIKTDNEDLFAFTLEEIAACGWKPEELSRDLHGSDLKARLTTSEYERKFSEAGKNINYVRVIPG